MGDRKNLPTKRVLVLAPLLIGSVAVGSFLASKSYVNAYRGRLSDSQLARVETAIFMLEPLTQMRRQLHRVAILGTDLDPSLVPQLETIREARKQFNEAYTAYAKAAVHREDGLSKPEIARYLQRFNQQCDRAIDEAETSLDRKPREATLRALRGTTATLTDAVSGELELSAREALDAHTALVRARAPTRRVSRLLDVVCVLATLLGVLLAMAVSSRYVQLSSRYEKLQSARLAEMELFAGRVAHDILGPLQPVSLGLDILNQKLTGDLEGREVLGRTRRSLNRARLIVEGLLRFARAGARPNSGARSSLWHVMEGVKEDLVPVATEAGVQLQVEYPPDVDVACEEAGVTVVLENLVRNAIKYIDGGIGREVIARAEVRDHCVHLMVRDSGPGLAPGSEQTIFQPYVRGEKTKQKPGIGLGLATVKRIAESHGGHVGVESLPGQGAVFWVDLPLAV